MQRLMKLMMVAACLFLAPLHLFARSIVTGYCQQGGEQVATGPWRSSTVVMRTYPLATVTVWISNTVILATIYSDSGGTPQANPLTADVRGYFQFYGDDAIFDIRCSGAGIVNPFVMHNFLAPQSAVLSVAGKTGAVTLAGSDLTNGTTGSGALVLQTSPTINTPTITSANLTGTPVAPTAAPGTNTTQLATTAFVTAATGGATLVPATRTISTTSPLTGGGDLSANRTFACATCAVTGTAINTTSPLAGGGDLSTTRTLTCSTCAVTNAANSWTATQLPNTSNSIDLGDSTHKWRDLWMGRTIQVPDGSTANPFLKRSAGSAGLLWNTDVFLQYYNGSQTLSLDTTSLTGGYNLTFVGSGTTVMPIIPQKITVTGLTNARTWTVPDQNFTIAAKEINNNFTAAQTITQSSVSPSLTVTTTGANNGVLIDSSSASAGSALTVNGASWFGAVAINANTTGAAASAIYGDYKEPGGASGGNGVFGIVSSTTTTGTSYGVRGFNRSQVSTTGYGAGFSAYGAPSIWAQASNASNTQPTAVLQDNGQAASTKMLDVQDSGGSSVASIDREGDLIVHSLAKINGVTTAGSFGVAPIVGNAADVLLTASKGTTNLVASAPAGMYRICFAETIAVAATTSSSIIVTIGWNSGAARTSTLASLNGGALTTAADTSNTVGSQLANCIVVSVVGTTNITYATTYASSGATAMQYNLTSTAERLQ